MKISIITVCFNSIDTIRDTIESVFRQQHEDIEYIICDGGSEDGTLELLETYKERIKLIYGPDKGIYDAMNKGIEAATGEVIGIINSDDYYAHGGVLSQVAASFQEPSVELSYGDLHYVHRNQTQKVFRIWKSGKPRRMKFKLGWSIPHPTLFVRKSVYEKYGSYEPSFQLAGDYELILRLMYKYQAKAVYISDVLVKMRTKGVGGSSVQNRLLAHAEDRMAWTNNQLKPAFFTIPLKPIRKIPQFFLPHLRDHKRFSLKLFRRKTTVSTTS